MWTTAQRDRLGMEHQILQREGFSQFTVWHNSNDDTYYASGIATSNSGKRYSLYSPIPSGYPTQRPPRRSKRGGVPPHCKRPPSGDQLEELPA
jgi:hypothetical protein